MTFDIKLLMLLGMFFMHFIDDYHLQGMLCDLKQKSWWQKNAPDDMYKYDYLMALGIHAFSWSLMISIIPISIAIYREQFIGCHLVIFIINAIIHSVVDDLKANKHKINLITDQTIHFIQIIITWVTLIVLK